MSNQNDWKVVKKPKKYKKPVPVNPIIEPYVETIESQPNTNQLEDLPLLFNYVFWCHDIHNKDWELSSYQKLCTITTVSEFWKLFNNINKLSHKTNNFFLMKEGTDPIWEHANNRHGGLCSFKTDASSSLKMYEDLCMRMMCSLLTNNPNEMDDINGISFSPKNNWNIIKIWNKDKANDLSKMLKPYILDTYKNVNIQYKENTPEY